MSENVKQVIIAALVTVAFITSVMITAICIMSAQDVRHKHTSEIERAHFAQITQTSTACIDKGYTWLNNNCLPIPKASTTP